MQVQISKQLSMLQMLIAVTMFPLWQVLNFSSLIWSAYIVTCKQFLVILSLTYQIYNYTLLPTCFMQLNTLPLDVYILQLILLTCSGQISHSKWYLSKTTCTLFDRLPVPNKTTAFIEKWDHLVKLAVLSASLHIYKESIQ